MAAFISIQPRDYYSTKLYTGTQAADNAITGLGFQPDLVWAKNRELTISNIVSDAVQGVQNYIITNTNAAQASNTGAVTSFDSDGFTLGGWDSINYLNDGYTSFNWKAGTTSGLSGGTITPSAYSINTNSGFGIYQYTGNATSGATIAHGLGVAPKVVWCKKISGAGSWSCGWKDGSTFAKYLTLDSDEGAYASSGYWNDTAPTATNIVLGNGHTNSSGVDQIMYAWAPVRGYSAMGAYHGNGNADGPFVYTGFRPAYVIIKRYGANGDTWGVWNNITLGYNPDNNSLHPNSDAVEGTGDYIDLYSNGFKPRNVAPAINGTSSYVYMAFAEFPFVSSNSKSGTAR
jgi:hypothetical protein